MNRIERALRALRKAVRESPAAELRELRAEVESRGDELERGREALLAIYDREPWRRSRLWELRAGPEYQPAFTEDEPLVSVVIPTYDNYRLLEERSIPSVLAQTYQNFEVVVVGDDAPPEARAVLESFGDSRISFHNRTYRGPYPEDPRERWLVAGVPPYNEAARRARGAWIAPLDDDDAFRPHHLQRLLEAAQENQWELAYGQVEIHRPDGGNERLGRFPPEHGHASLQMAIYHAGLVPIFELELIDALFNIPSDWGLFRRMLRAGVRMGMLDAVVVDGYPSALWMRREGASAPEPAAASQPEWEYVPEGWERARDPDQACARGWDVEAVAETYAANWPAFLSAGEGPGPLGISYEVPRGAEVGNTSLVDQNTVLCFGLALARAAWGRERVSVLDWGGALGHYRILAGKLLPEVELDYHVRELPAVVRQGRRLAGDVTFHDTDECLGRSYDLVVLSSSLQYAEDWRRQLSRLAEAAGRKLLITRVGVVESHESFVVIQRAQAYGYETEYLSWVFHRGELAAAAREAGLELEREFLIHDPFEIHGAPETVHHRGFLYGTPE
jgi:putative methyltransferase (TIGR04325 family)